jgi:hypothetical protein
MWLRRTHRVRIGWSVYGSLIARDSAFGGDVGELPHPERHVLLGGALEPDPDRAAQDRAQ